MKKLLVLTISIVLGIGVQSAWAQPYSADLTADNYASVNNGIPTPNDTTSLGQTPQIYEAINVLLGHASLPGISSNEAADAYAYTWANSFWSHLGGGGAIADDFVAISITAGNLNTLSVYQEGADTSNPASFTDVLGPFTGTQFLGSGTLSDPYPGGINPFTSGEDFGFALLSQDGSKKVRWYSDPTENSDKIDHMLAYHLSFLDDVPVYVDLGAGPTQITFSKDTYLLAWEDRNVNLLVFDDDYNDTVFVVTRVAPAPEPMSLVLLGTGLLGMFGIRRKQQ